MNIALSTFAAFSLGAMHALEPGHGKTFVTSYLLTGRSNRKQLFIMGLSMALSHTLVLLALGLMLMFLSAQLASVVQEVILIGSPLLVIGIGLYMIYRLRNKKQTCGCKSHSCDKHTSSEVKTVSNKTAALVGFTGGLLPCPSAIAVFSLGGANASADSAFCMMMLYVAGFIIVMGMLIIGASFINNKFVSKYFKQSKALLIQKLSAYAILLTGVIYLVHNVTEHI
ncbi:MAG: sulfite exporter TauE/SafE family protein [Cytophagaceae bacterium]